MHNGSGPVCLRNPTFAELRGIYLLSRMASLALEHGAPPATLAKSMSRVPTDPWGIAREPASPVGAAMDLLAAMLRVP